MAAPQLYPLSTQDGQAIPLDIVEPTAFFFRALTIDVAETFTLPAGFGICYIYSEVDCIFSQNATPIVNVPVEGTTYNDAIFIPSETLMVLKLTPGTVSAVGFATGKIRFTACRQWAALAQTIQSSYG